MRLNRAVFCLWFGFLVSCSNQAPPTASLGEAYVGPSTLNLRSALARQSSITATAKHGDKVDIVEYRHRLVKVRTAAGAEGWTDLRELLSPAQMDGLRQMAETAARYPSQGAATVFEPLNVHTEPNRSSPSFWQIPENGKVDVIGHKLAPRTQPPEIFEPPQVRRAPVRRKSKAKASQSKIPPPPRPPAPKPPPNWQALSVPNSNSLETAQTDQPKVQAAPPPAPPPAPPVPMDDWSLVRGPEGKAGWVLTRPLSMAIPDEVAQYAEGHRITSYFALGQVHDKDLMKNNWLWTTITKGQQPYEFDSFRVFVWSLKHHRYETAYIERDVAGHFPVEVDNSGSAPRFTLVLERDDGQLQRKTYTFEGFRVRMVASEPYQAKPVLEIPKASLPVPHSAAPSRSWYAKVKDRLRRLFH